jgi:acetoacetyl-CoA synthetase
VPEFAAVNAAPAFEAVPFAHPLWIGDGGMETHGGVLLETLRRDGLHHDTGPGDRVLGCLASAEPLWATLAVGATVVTCAGPPPTAEALLRACAAHRVSRLDIAASHLAACARSGVHAPERHDLSALRTVVTTAAAPLAAWQWVHAHVKRDVLLGVDLLDAGGSTVLVGTNPLLPLYAGELQAPVLGIRVEQHASGALVATTPQPASSAAGHGEIAVRVRPTPYGSYRVTEGTDHGSADRTR